MWDAAVCGNPEMSSGSGDFLSKDSSGIRLEPGPAIFYLTGENGENEEELLTVEVDPVAFQDRLDENGHSDVKEEEPMNISLSLEELKAHGLRMEDLVPVSDQENDLAEDDADRVETIKTTKPKSLSSVPDDKSTHYACKKCEGSEPLSSYESVLLHMLDNHCHPPKFYSCSLCDSELAKESSLKKHVRNVHFRMEAFECPICTKEIQQRSHLKQHIEKVHGGRQALSKVLAKAKHIFKSSPDFFNEALESGTEVQGFCKVLTTSTNLNKSNNGVGKDDRSCHLCHKVYFTKETRDRHLVTFHKVDVDDYEADVNNQKPSVVFKEDGDLLTLMNEVIKCKLCSILCTSKLHFVLHVKEAHGSAENGAPSRTKAVVPAKPPAADIVKKENPPPSGRSFCPICGVDCGDLPSKFDHVLAVHESLKGFSCDICMKEFHSSSHLEAHLMHFHAKASRDGPISCDQCEFTVRKTERLLSHVAEVHRFQCPECEKHFRRVSRVQDHYFNAHCRDGCGRMPAAVIKREEDEDEMVDVESSSPCAGSAFCIVCQIDFMSIKALIDHVVESHNYVCQVCEREYKLADSIRKHCKKDHPDRYEGPIVCCRLCPSIFLSASEKLEHMTKVHNVAMNGSQYVSMVEVVDSPSPPPSCMPESPPPDSLFPPEEYDCPECKKTYGYPDSLRKHAKLNHGMAVGFCRDCIMVFPSHEDKAVHMEEVHRGGYCIEVVGMKRKSSEEADRAVAKTPSVVEEAGYKCPVCPKVYNLAKSLRKHCSKTHNRRVSFCPGCTGVFTCQEVRDSHIASGCGKLSSPLNVEAVFVCPVCQASVKTEAEAQSHIRDGHGWLDAFVCGNCRAILRTGEEGRSHMKTCRAAKRRKRSGGKNGGAIDEAAPSHVVLSNEDVTIPESYVDVVELATGPRSPSPGEFHGFQPPAKEMDARESLNGFRTKLQFQ